MLLCSAGWNPPIQTIVYHGSGFLLAAQIIFCIISLPLQSRTYRGQSLGLTAAPQETQQGHLKHLRQTLTFSVGVLHILIIMAFRLLVEKTYCLCLSFGRTHAVSTKNVVKSLCEPFENVTKTSPVMIKLNEFVSIFSTMS